MTASLVQGSLYWPLGLFLSLHTLASIVFGAIPGRVKSAIKYCVCKETAGKTYT